MKSGWRVRRARARRQDRLWAGTLLGGPSGHVGGPSTMGRETRRNTGLVQVVQAVQAVESLQDESERERETRHPIVAHKCVSSADIEKCLDHLDHLDQASKSAGFSGPSVGFQPGPPGPEGVQTTPRPSETRSVANCKACRKVRPIGRAGICDQCHRPTMQVMVAAS
jgi:hypothetical protein